MATITEIPLIEESNRTGEVAKYIYITRVQTHKPILDTETLISEGKIHSLVRVSISHAVSVPKFHELHSTGVFDYNDNVRQSTKRARRGVAKCILSYEIVEKFNAYPDKKDQKVGKEVNKHNKKTPTSAKELQNMLISMYASKSNVAAHRAGAVICSFNTAGECDGWIKNSMCRDIVGMYAVRVRVLEPLADCNIYTTNKTGDRMARPLFVHTCYSDERPINPSKTNKDTVSFVNLDTDAPHILAGNPALGVESITFRHLATKTSFTRLEQAVDTVRSWYSDFDIRHITLPESELKSASMRY